MIDFKKIKEELILDLFNGVKSVINGEIDNYKNSFLSPNDIITHLKHIGFIDLERFDSNGWQYDNWHYFKFEEKTYVVSGSGYYGGITFYFIDEEE